MTETAGAALTAVVGRQGVAVVRRATVHRAGVVRPDRTPLVRAEPVALRTAAGRGSETPGRPTAIDPPGATGRIVTAHGRRETARVRRATESARGARDRLATGHGRLATMLVRLATARGRLAMAHGRLAMEPARPAMGSGPGVRVRLAAAATARRVRGRIDPLRAVARMSGPTRRARHAERARRVRPAVRTAARTAAATTAVAPSVRAPIAVLVRIVVLAPTVPADLRAAVVPTVAPGLAVTRATAAANGRIAIR